MFYFYAGILMFVFLYYCNLLGININKFEINPKFHLPVFLI